MYGVYSRSLKIADLRRALTSFGSSHGPPVLHYAKAFEDLEFLTERPRRLCAYWEEKRSGQGAPNKRDLDLMELYEIAPNLMVRDVIGDGEEYWTRYWGSQLSALFGYELTGKLMREFYPPDAVAVIRQTYDYILKTGNPLRLIGHVGFSDDKEHRNYEAFHTPWIDEDGAVVQIVSCYEFKGGGQIPVDEFPNPADGWKLIRDPD